MKRKREPTERNRNWVAILYPDNERHIKAVTKLEQLKYPAIWILHDKDEKEKDEAEEEEEKKSDDSKIDFKKAHWHILMCFENQRSWATIYNELDIEPHLLRFRSDFKRVGKTNDAYMRYMVHRGEFDKYQYPLSAVKGDQVLKERLRLACENYNVDEKDRVEILMQFIDEAEKPITKRSFMRFCNSKGFWGTFRNSVTAWGWYIDERNLEIEEELKLKLINPFTQSQKENKEE